MLYELNENSLNPIEFFDISEIGGLEKDLENILSENMLLQLFENNKYLPIHQERTFQSD